MTKLGRPRVLVVDDEPSNLATIRRAFRAELDMTLAVSPQEALDALQTHLFEVALVDFAMPQMNGIQLVRKFAELAPEMHCILVTAYCDLEEVRAAKSSNLVAAVVAKPWEREELLRWTLQAARLTSMRGAVRSMRSQVKPSE